MTEIRGSALLLGDQIDTDRIIPARYCDSDDPTRLATALFADFDSTLAQRAAGAIVIAGRHLGCGSSRETAPLALQAAGVRALVARSFARIFYRNAINLGLPALELSEEPQGLLDGIELRLDPWAARLEAPGLERAWRLRQPPPRVAEILKAGGLVTWVRNRRGGR